MKSESTIRRNARRCRQFINANEGNHDPITELRVDRAFATETALLWVLSKGNRYSAFDHVNYDYAKGTIHRLQKEMRP